MSDLVLSLDTSTPQLSAALLLREDGALKLLARREISPPVVVSTRIPAVFDELLEEAGESKERLGLLVSGVGPGLFTGIRVAMATMKALAYARRLPLLGAQSLEALSLAAARGAEAQKGERFAASKILDGQLLCPVLDARKGEVYFALYRAEGGRLRTEREAGAGTPLDLARLLKAKALEALEQGAGDGKGKEILVFGTGVDPLSPHLTPETLGEALDDISVSSNFRFPKAAELAALALFQHSQESSENPRFSLDEVIALEPTYLRPPEAQLARERRLARQAENGSSGR